MPNGAPRIVALERKIFARRISDVSPLVYYSTQQNAVCHALSPEDYKLQRKLHPVLYCGHDAQGSIECFRSSILALVRGQGREPGIASVARVSEDTGESEKMLLNGMDATLPALRCER